MIAPDPLGAVPSPRMGVAPDYSSPPVVRAVNVGVRYGPTWALQGCSVTVPAGSVTALVGGNGAGKTTLLGLLAGLRRASTGELSVLGEPVVAGRASPTQLAGVSFLAQDKPLYGHLSVADMMRFGAVMNPGWDAEYAAARVARHRLPAKRKVATLSGGQRTQLALTLALAKRPRLLVLDEPLAELDPLARKEVLGELMAEVADRGTTVLLSSHILGELAQVCDRLILLREGEVGVCGAVDEIIEAHTLLAGSSDLLPGLSTFGDVVDCDVSPHQVIALLRRHSDTTFLDPRWQLHPAGLEAIVMGYLRAVTPTPANGSTVGQVRR